ncbi:MULTISPECIES: TetR/AcrR family transcriptional regulator [unclassified Dietzia]|uniref:TetR/AcrR family transcriptional regulator n=1 Tax=unclassified Dietzia TaxID=2617939 RepID=UPI000D210190|nr:MULTISPECIES: TetR/AcrR family transcriptional regulator [unclassified Dietzia]AVZ39858.1 TetR family transcriptional regulator [Dietzia sp. JS16-p6b]QGW25235.1 putative TetR family transcriptional regulator [Dietzia sp. DQ12-45-1b]
MPEAASTRTYRSTLRAEQAANTRSRVVAAAATCFADRGYAGTSLGEIAERAGVSTETVKANGPKRALLLSAFDQAFAGDEGDELLTESDTGRDLVGIGDNDGFLSALAGFIAAANARTSVLWGEYLAAANADPTIDEALTALLQRRHLDFRRTIEQFVARGMTSRVDDVDGAAAILSFLWSPESHQQLVLQSGWTHQRYETWLIDAARRQFSM